MNRDDIIRMAREVADVETDSRGRETFSFDCYGIERFANLATAEKQKKCDRYRHAMGEAMYLLDRPEPRPHAAFSELLLALNPDLPSAIRARGDK